MGPDTTQPWSGLPQDLQSPITTMAGHLELLRRRILRADGLTPLERDLMLTGLAAARLDLEHLVRRVERQTRDQHPSSGGSDTGWSRR